MLEKKKGVYGKCYSFWMFIWKDEREKEKEDKWIGGVTNKEKYGIDRRIIT